MFMGRLTSCGGLFPSLQDVALCLPFCFAIDQRDFKYESVPHVAGSLGPPVTSAGICDNFFSSVSPQRTHQQTPPLPSSPPEAEEPVGRPVRVSKPSRRAPGPNTDLARELFFSERQLVICKMGYEHLLQGKL